MVSSEQLRARSDEMRDRLIALIRDYIEVAGAEATVAILNGSSRNVRYSAERVGRWNEQRYLALETLAESTSRSSWDALEKR